MTIAIYGARHQDDYLTQIGEFLQLLAQHRIEVVMHRKLYDALVHIMPAKLAAVRKVVSTPDFTADFALSIGGDGTFLRTAMWVADKLIPILGINTGHLGYLSHASIDELPQMLDQLIRGEYTLEQRSLIEVSSPAINTWPYALNEVAVMKEENASMIIANTTINGQPLAQYRADGLVVSTATGSTAYNLSIGGPIIQPSAPVWSVAPIAAHSLGMRPLVVEDSSVISITVEARAHSWRIALDGRPCTLPIGETITLRKAPFTINLINRPGSSFATTLRQKLHWNE